MAPPQNGPKKSTRRSRKARTEVSSSSEASSSDSEGSISSPEPKKSSKSVPRVTAESRETASPSPVEEVSVQAPKTDNEQAFENFYLRQSAKEFSDDLDKLRSANDFKGQSSVELLVGALKQGGACFSKEERMRVGGGAGTGVTDTK